MLAVVTGRSEDDVDEALESEGAQMCALTGSAEVWARHGVEHPMGADFTGTQDIQPQTVDEQTAERPIKSSSRWPGGAPSGQRRL
jgi:phthiodiolone/phenolphthiodiolone dimycocerosates ketoreductase